MTSRLSLAALAVLTMLAMPRAANAVECSIGILAPLSGGRKALGDAILAGARLAASEPSSNGVTIRLTTYDSLCDARQSVVGMNAAVAARVQGVLGDVCSSASLAASAVANARRIPMISATSSSPLLTTLGGAYFFRVNPSDTIQGPFLAGLALTKGQKVGIIFGAEPYGTGIFFEMFKELNARNGTIVGAIGTSSTWTAGTLGGILAGRPDSVIIASNYLPEIYRAAVELRARGFRGQIYSSDSVSSDSSALVGPVGAALNGSISVSFYGGSAAFQAKYRAAYRVTEVPPSAASAYDAILAFRAVCAAGGRLQTGEQIQRALLRPGFSVPGATGTIRFDSNGDRVTTSLTRTFSLLVGTPRLWRLQP